MTNAINWFEIPVTNFEKAKTFYETVLGVEITNHPMENMEYGIFPYTMEGHCVGGAIVQMKDFNPSADGCCVYLNGGDDLSNALSRVESSGGKILMPKTDIQENGFIALFSDQDGNRIGLHSMK
ncbi:MAG: VOC family protein [Cellulophaga sp.]